MNRPRICLPAQFHFDDLFLGKMTSAIHLYLLWTHDKPSISRPCNVDVQEEQRAPCSMWIWGCSQQATSMSGRFSPSAAWMTLGSPTLNARLRPINTFRRFVGSQTLQFHTPYPTDIFNFSGCRGNGRI